MATNMNHREIKTRQFWHFFIAVSSRRMGGRTDRTNMADTMVLPRRSVTHPHNLPALLESEGDVRERRREGESDGETKVHKMLMS